MTCPTTEGGSARSDPPGAERRRNRDVWSEVSRQFTDGDAEHRWQAGDIEWGLFRIPEQGLGVLGPLDGLDVAELGCGTAYVSAQLARRGARPVGVDLSPEQLRSARRCQALFGPTFPLVEASADQLPLRSCSFDLVVSEYGAAPWCRPDRWLAEAARLLRPGGRLVFLTNSVLAALCVPEDGGVAGDRLLRSQRSLQRIAWPGGGVEHHPGHGDWIRELRSADFTVEALHELVADDDATTPEYYDIVTGAWARRWPAEDLWVARLGTGADPLRAGGDAPPRPE
jgi:SAM-dependent methyltransferase